MLSQSEAYYRSKWKSRHPLEMKKVLAQEATDRPAVSANRPKRRFDCDSKDSELELVTIYRSFISSYRIVFAGFRKSATLGFMFRGDWPSGSYPPGCWQPVIEQ